MNILKKMTLGKIERALKMVECIQGLSLGLDELLEELSRDEQIDKWKKDEIEMLYQKFDVELFEKIWETLEDTMIELLEEGEEF